MKFKVKDFGLDSRLACLSGSETSVEIKDIMREIFYNLQTVCDCVKTAAYCCSACETELIAFCEASFPSDCGLQTLFKEPRLHMISFPSAAESPNWPLKSGPCLKKLGDLYKNLCIFCLVCFYNFPQFDFKGIAPATEGLIKIQLDFRVMHLLKSESRAYMTGQNWFLCSGPADNKLFLLYTAQSTNNNVLQAVAEFLVLHKNL